MNFQSTIESIVASYENASAPSEKTIVAFRGIGAQQAAYVASRPAALANGAAYVSAAGELDLLALEAAQQQLLVAALQATGTVFALYEELLLLASSLPIIGAKVVVADNNLFRGNHAPCCVKADQAAQLADFFASELVHESESALQKVAGALYADLTPMAKTCDMVTYISPLTDADISYAPLFQRAELPEQSTAAAAAGELFELSRDSVERYALALADGAEQPVAINLSTQIPQGVREFAEVFYGALGALGIPAGVCWSDPYAWEKDEEVTPDLEALLKRHWGADAEFRTLKFYENPARGKELSDVSQGVIVSQVVEQAEAALEGRSFRNLFITAPTGAGKSLLFQLPAVYLARKHGALTFVISPLISLMKDQVRHLSEQGVGEATYFNSDLSHQERDRRLEQVLSGRYSIIYTSPEMFQSSFQIREILDKRKLALMVVDEAHTVTTWGRDFRSSYWLLGDQFRALKAAGMSFPIMCLTATAVLGGADDTVSQTQQELGIDNPLTYFGNVKRDNIAFDIKRRERKDFPGELEQAKLDLAAAKIGEIVEGGHKGLVYCPYVSQTGDVQDAAQGAGVPRKKVWKYNGRMEKDQKDIAVSNFNAQPSAALVCTKAFGMGVDLSDVDRVYHYAPTGGLADYVQEIGRAGRKKGSQAVASIDFFSNDTRYTRSLAGMNSITRKELRQVMAKLYEIYENNGKRRNLLVSPESFSYIFGEDDCAAKFQRAMMILREDFQNRTGYPLLVVKPQASFTKNYVNVPADSEESFLEKYGSFAKLVPQPKPRVSYQGRKGSSIKTNTGKIYKVDMAQLWQEQFADLTFPQVKRAFNLQELFEVAGHPVSPRQHLVVRFNAPFKETLDKYEDYLKCIDSAFMGFKSRNKAFSKKDFAEMVAGLAGEEFELKDNLGAVLDFFVTSEYYRGENSRIKDPVVCVFQRRLPGRLESQYLITRQTYVSVANNLVKEGSACVPTSDDGLVYETYLPSSKKACNTQELRFASLIQLFGLGTYEIAGGEDAQMFVRINRPLELKRAAEDPRYHNAVLKDMNDRKDRAAAIMNRFFMTELSDEERWDVIEDYFLGDMSAVYHALGIEE